MKSPFLLALAGSLALAGCITQSYIVLIPNPDDGKVGAISLQDASGGSTALDQPGQMAAGKTYDLPKDKMNDDFHDAMEAQPPLPERYTLYFDDDGRSLTAASKAMLPWIIASVQRRKSPDLSIIGHTDTVGSEDDNKAKGLKNARRVAELLEDGGLRAIAIAIVSHGESNLKVPTPDETPEPANRRVEVHIR
ncbi:MAG: hypothetical protein RIR00_1867 [Pseudomonadota bacterium]|jgi:outer membrane protein OmpA-like peptidoglycan-associated protein